ncbi:MAG: helix-turn-helix transcriptional regulator [Ekhidna sp.]
MKENSIFAIVNTEQKYLTALGLKIKRLREAKGFEQKAFAIFCEVGRTQLYKIEKGQTNPRLLTLMKIANGLKIQVAELLSTED